MFRMFPDSKKTMYMIPAVNSSHNTCLRLGTTISSADYRFGSYADFTYFAIYSHVSVFANTLWIWKPHNPTKNTHILDMHQRSCELTCKLLVRYRLLQFIAVRRKWFQIIIALVKIVRVIVYVVYNLCPPKCSMHNFTMQGSCGGINVLNCRVRSIQSAVHNALDLMAI